MLNGVALNHIFEVIAPVLFLIIGWFCKRTLDRVEAKQDETLEQTTLTNGGLRELKVWTSAHEKLDDERFSRTEQTHKDIWEQLNKKV